MQPHRIKCSDQFTVNKRDTDSFEHLHEKNTNPQVHVSVSHARSKVFLMVFTGGREGVTEF